MKAKLEKLLAEYGFLAIGIGTALFLLTFAGFFIAINVGFHPKSGSGKGGVVLAAYLATEATKLLRIGITVVITPVVARVWRKIRPPKPAPADPPTA
jgi:hypothetical protein